MNNYKKISVWAVLSVGLTMGGTAGINPVLQKIMETWPEQSLSSVLMVSTLPSLISMIVSILAGTVVGRKIRFKTCILLGLLCWLIGGAGPFFTKSFPVLLMMRAVFGAGLGFVACTGAAIMAMFSDSEDRAKNLGYYIFMTNAGAVIIQFMSGFLGDISLQISFLIYLIGLIPLVLVLLFMKEPAAEQSKGADAGSKKPSIKSYNILFILTMMLSTVWLYPVLANMSSFIQNKNLGAATIAGTVLAFYSVGGAVGGALFGKIYAATKRFIGVIVFGSMAIGQALVLFGGNLVMITIGAFLCGFGFFSLQPMLMVFTGMVTEPESVSLNTLLIQSATNMGIFLSSYWILMCGKIFSGDAVTGPFYAAVVLFAVITLFTLIKDPRPVKKEN